MAKARAMDEDSKTVYCGTRYGNVMASRGSVIPLFVQQIKEGKDITITDPNMTRFMMTLEDAVDLVVYAFQHGNNGDMFVQKAPASTIADLAQALIELYNSKSKVRVIGTRHGEKLYETLVNREEMAKATDMGNYFRVPADNRGSIMQVISRKAKKKFQKWKIITRTIPADWMWKEQKNY